MQMNKGFTATEIIVVIVILGILAILSVSRFNVYLAKGRQAEAKVNLTTIGSLQETWKFGHGKYNNKPGGVVGASGTTNKCNPTASEMGNELGFSPKDCSELRYGYNWDTSEAIATSTSNKNKYIYPGCDEIDKWELTYATAGLENSAPSVIKKCTD